VTAFWDLLTYAYVCVIQYVIIITIIIIIIIIIINPLKLQWLSYVLPSTNTNKNYVFPSKYVCVTFILKINGDYVINPLKPELNPICYLLALLGAHHFLHVSRIRVKLLTFRLLMSYIYGAPILDVSRSHTTTQHSR